MSAPETVMSEYIKGFDAGYEYVLHEMERYIRVREFEPRVANPLKDLLTHLKMKGNKHIRENT